MHLACRKAAARYLGEQREETLKIMIRVALALAVLISLTACATSDAAKRNLLANYAFIHKDFDFRYAWKTGQTGKGLLVEGLIKNVRYPRVENVEINVSLLNKEKKVLAKATTFPAGQPIPSNEYRRFELLLKDVQLSEGDQLQFLVTYVGSAGQEAISWISSFTVNAATGQVKGVRVQTGDDW
jgi:hypothetical protein